MIGLIKDVPGLNRARLNVPERSKVAVEMIGLRSAASQSADLESRTRTLPHRTLLGTAISPGVPEPGWRICHKCITNRQRQCTMRQEYLETIRITTGISERRDSDVLEVDKSLIFIQLIIWLVCSN
jgi:hypothetical protein